MALLKLFVVSILCGAISLAMAQQPTWPRPDSLYAFFPLSEKYGCADVGPNAWIKTATCSRGKVAKMYPQEGPFGDANTGCLDCGFAIDFWNVASFKLPGSFTLSFYVKILSVPKENKWYILWVSHNGFQLDYNPGQSTLRINYHYGLPTDQQQWANADYKVLQVDSWTFLAFVYDQSAGSLTTYTRHGIAYSPKYLTTLSDIPFGGFSFPHAILPEDVVSCLMVYNAALNQGEIFGIQDACALAHGSTPPGLPKLPMPSISAALNKPQIPKVGQFPWMVSIRNSYGHVVCTASLVDKFRAVAAASCFGLWTQATTPWSAVTADHDLGIPDPDETVHQIKYVFKHPDGKPYDVAIVEFVSPVKLNSAYVNSIPFVRTTSDLQSSTCLFAGWGLKGRSSSLALASQTALRYISGNPISDSDCKYTYLIKEVTSSFVEGAHICFQPNVTDTKSDPEAPCDIDLGGPLMGSIFDSTIHTQRMVQFGVFSLHDGGCSSKVPSLFVTKSKAAQWVSDTLACHIPGIADFHPSHCPMPAPEWRR